MPVGSENISKVYGIDHNENLYMRYRLIFFFPIFFWGGGCMIRVRLLKLKLMFNTEKRDFGLSSVNRYFLARVIVLRISYLHSTSPFLVYFQVLCTT